METGSMRAAPIKQSLQLDWGGIGTWLLGFGLVVFLGLEGGGYDPIVYSQVGIAAWWLLLATVLAGALPRTRLGRPALAGLILFGAFALWMVLSLAWTDTADRTFLELSRAVTYLGIFALALGTRRSGDTGMLLGAVASGICVVVGLALLSRLEPTLIESSQQTGRLLGPIERLSYPLNYWNGLACIAAIGVPVLLHFATGARLLALRALAAAAIPAFALVLYFTISRGGIVAAAVAVAVFFAFAADRLPKLGIGVIVAAGAAVLLLAAHDRQELRDGLENEVAKSQGGEMLLYVILVGAIVAGLVAGLALLGRRAERPAWTRPTRAASAWALGAGIVIVLIAALALDAPGRISDGWDEFKGGGNAGDGAQRLSSFAGESRYELWSSAVDEFEAEPVYGGGAGSFQYWWARTGGAETVRDAHSLYLQTLGELGLVGFLLLVGFFAVVAVFGLRHAFGTDAEERSRLAAALAGVTAFAVAALVDWVWQIPVLPVAMLLLASSLLVRPGASGEKPRLAWPWRGGVAVGSLAAIVLVAIPLAALALIRESESDVRGGDLGAALEAARSAQNVQPYTAAPRLQEALVLELERDFGAAEEAARAATERERTNWRNWLVLSRIAAENGRADVAVAAFEKSRSLNPEAVIFLR